MVGSLDHKRRSLFRVLVSPPVVTFVTAYVGAVSFVPSLSEDDTLATAALRRTSVRCHGLPQEARGVPPVVVALIVRDALTRNYSW
jgi:hypothetical protein